MSIFRSVGTISYAVRIFANLVPLGAALLAGWDAAALVALYWAENVIVGLYQVPRIAVSRADIGDRRFYTRWGGKLFYILFFCIAFGIFCLFQGGLILGVIALRRETTLQSALNDADLKALFYPLLWPLLILFLSHGISFIQDLRAGLRGEAETIREQVVRPFFGVLVLQGAIFAAFLLFLAVGSTGAPALLALLVGLKTGLELFLYYARSRRTGQGVIVQGETSGFGNE